MQLNRREQVRQGACAKYKVDSGWCSGHQWPALHLYDPGSIPGLRMWAEICRSQSESEGFSPGTLVFLPLQIRLSFQDLSRSAIKH